MDAYSTPFDPVCAKCNSLASAFAFINDGTIDCLRCSKKFPYIYRHCLNAAIWTVGNTIVHCTIRQHLLQDVLPGLVEFSYEVYLQKKANNVYMLCDFCIHNKFTLNEDNAILHIDWKKIKIIISIFGRNWKNLMCVCNFSSTPRWMFVGLEFFGVYIYSCKIIFPYILCLLLHLKQQGESNYKCNQCCYFDFFCISQ